MKKPIFLLLAIFTLTSLACAGLSGGSADQILDLSSDDEPFDGPIINGIIPYDCIPANDPESAIVSFVYDGDTIQAVIDGEEFKVRLIGIDTPEQGEFYYDEATQYMASLLPFGTEVMLYRDTSDTDQYGRLLRYVLMDNTFVNYKLVSLGYAYAKSYHPDTACDTTFDEAESTAIEHQVGIHQP